MGRDWYDWNSSSSMDDSWKYRIQELENDGEQAGLQWNGRCVEVENPEGRREYFTVFVDHDSISGPYAELSLLGMSNWCLRYEIRNALATAVSLSMQPLVKWRGSDEVNTYEIT